MQKNNQTPKANGLALIPFLVFVAVYLGAGILLQAQGVEMAFYQFPSPVALTIGVVLAFMMFKGGIDKNFKDFAKGCGNENIITMLIIYLLAGAFAGVAGAMGGSASTAALGISLIPIEFLAAGLFVISAFMAVSTGTSMGTIGAITPIALEVANQANLSIPIVIAAVVGGAMFGDNLSIISDTTIAATKTQGVEMRDKFKVNFLIAAPAAIITIILLIIFGGPEIITQIPVQEYDIIKVIPYIFVLVSAIAGLNVFLVLLLGTLLAGAIGLFTGDLTILTLAQNVYSGYTGMTEVFLLSFATGGLSYMVTVNGGLQWLIEKIQSFAKNKRSAEMGIVALTAAADMATANNTVAIVIVGPMAKSISTKFKVDPRRTASLLDITSCVVQGAIPYGAQLLVAGSLAGVSPTEVIPLLWYQMLLAVFAIVSIFVPFADGLIKKNPWNFDEESQDEVETV